jgi:hypothetical protein
MCEPLLFHRQELTGIVRTTMITSNIPRLLDSFVSLGVFVGNNAFNVKDSNTVG